MPMGHLRICARDPTWPLTALDYRDGRTAAVRRSPPWQPACPAARQPDFVPLWRSIRLAGSRASLTTDTCHTHRSAYSMVQLTRKYHRAAAVSWWSEARPRAELSRSAFIRARHTASTTLAVNVSISRQMQLRQKMLCSARCNSSPNNWQGRHATLERLGGKRKGAKHRYSQQRR